MNITANPPTTATVPAHFIASPFRLNFSLTIKLGANRPIMAEPAKINSGFELNTVEARATGPNWIVQNAITVAAVAIA